MCKKHNNLYRRTRLLCSVDLLVSSSLPLISHNINFKTVTQYSTESRKGETSGEEWRWYLNTKKIVTGKRNMNTEKLWFSWKKGTSAFPRKYDEFLNSKHEGSHEHHLVLRMWNVKNNFFTNKNWFNLIYDHFIHI